ncbi:MAG TPA: HAMP domain-containing sensor histidine kinase [Phenylobacterium sp.]|nr:HAMP domain-containing sensor histidine kinase [Phenylobacterium sp.]
MRRPLAPRSRPPTLFAQISIRLALLAVVFVLLDIGMVVMNYAHDRQVLAEDFVVQQTGRIERVWRRDSGADADPSLRSLRRPMGVSAWAYSVVDASRGPAFMAGDAALAAGLPRPGPDTLDWVRRDRTASGLRISGGRRFDAEGGPHWVLISAETHDLRFYLPVLARELVDHVAEPLGPLMVLLLAFNVIVVRRVLAPLSAVADQVDSFDPTRMEARLTEPATSREVAALVAALNRALDRLQHAMRLLKDFTADAAHELRTPLAVLQMRVEALSDGDAKQRLRQDVQAMVRLVNQMLDLSQADALSMDQAADVDLLDLAKETVAQIAPLAFAADRDIRVIDKGAVPIRGHADALGRALRNLVENAVAHAGGNGPIEVIAGPGPRLSVRDHGQGLASLDPEIIFRRFWRKRRGHNGGAGLGLGIARSIVEAHGGTISAQNAPDGGAIFLCEFAAAGSPSVRAPQAPPLGSDAPAS